MPSKPDKFVWPPKPLTPAELAAPAEHLSEGALHLLTNTFDDVLLEEPEDELSGDFDTDHEAPASVAPEAPTGFRRWLEAFEIHHLGRTAAPWDTRAANNNWTADEPGDYCPRCGSTVRPFELDTLNNPATCVYCRDKKPSWDRFIRLAPYQGVLSRSIRELKFARFRALGDRLGELLGHSIAAELASANIAPSRVLLVPIPMTPWRRLSRGVDHSLVIARGIRRSTNLPIAKLLVRRHRPSQLEIPPSQRRQNVSGAFYCCRGVLKVPQNAVLVVVDDVRTTGATMMEACRVLKKGLEAREGRFSSLSPDMIRTNAWAATVGVARRPGEQNVEKVGVENVHRKSW